ncbi:MAG: ROK family protein [Patescibacteria group bacterium]|nr:ROK family protein [Patescibacteria group bacterium]
MYFVADVGGTKTRLGWTRNLNSIEKLELFNTPQNYFDFLDLLRSIVAKNSSKNLKGVCVGLAGVFDEQKKRLVYSPNLREYEGKNIRSDLERIFKKRVLLENDAFLAGLGEAKFGAGKIFDFFGYLTLGSGVGGVRIINSPNGFRSNIFSSEPGHSYLLISLDKTKNLLIEVEDLLGGKSIESIFSIEPKNINNPIFWKNYVKILSIFLINISLLWSIDKFVIGGSISKKIKIADLVEKTKNFHPWGLKLKIKRSKLDEFAGLYGGLVRIKLS